MGRNSRFSQSLTGHKGNYPSSGANVKGAESSAGAFPAGSGISIRSGSISRSINRIPTSILPSGHTHPGPKEHGVGVYLHGRMVLLYLKLFETE